MVGTGHIGVTYESYSQWEQGVLARGSDKKATMFALWNDIQPPFATASMRRFSTFVVDCISGHTDRYQNAAAYTSHLSGSATKLRDATAKEEKYKADFRSICETTKAYDFQWEHKDGPVVGTRKIVVLLESPELVCLFRMRMEYLRRAASDFQYFTVATKQRPADPEAKSKSNPDEIQVRDARDAIAAFKSSPNTHLALVTDDASILTPSLLAAARKVFIAATKPAETDAVNRFNLKDKLL